MVYTVIASVTVSIRSRYISGDFQDSHVGGLCTMTTVFGSSSMGK